MDGQTPRKRKKLLRRVARGVVVVAVLVGVAVAALPWLLSRPAARVEIVKRVNRAIAPGKVGLRGLSLSWSGPIRLTGLSLKDGRGKTLIDARRAAIDRGLLALIRDPSRLGTVTLDEAAVDIERRADGSIDLVDALVPRSPAPPKTPAPPPAPERAGTGGVDV